MFGSCIVMVFRKQLIFRSGGIGNCFCNSCQYILVNFGYCKECETLYVYVCKSVKLVYMFYVNNWAESSWSDDQVWLVRQWFN